MVAHESDSEQGSQYQSSCGAVKGGDTAVASGDSTTSGPNGTQSDGESEDDQNEDDSMIPPPICDGHDKSPMSDIDDGSDTDSSYTLELPGDRPISEQRRKRKFIPIQHDRMHGSDSETNQEDCTS